MTTQLTHTGENCRIYCDLEHQWVACWYELNGEVYTPRYRDGSSRAELMIWAKRCGFAGFFDGYASQVTPL